MRAVAARVQRADPGAVVDDGPVALDSGGGVHVALTLGDDGHQKAVEGVTVVGISDVKTGNDDGEFTFMCLADGQKLNISVLIPGAYFPLLAIRTFA